MGYVYISSKDQLQLLIQFLESNSLSHNDPLIHSLLNIELRKLSKKLISRYLLNRFPYKGKLSENEILLYRKYFAQHYEAIMAEPIIAHVFVGISVTPTLRRKFAGY